MAHNQSEGRPALKAASGIGQYVPVSFLEGGSALSETIIRSGSQNNYPFGITLATAASPGDPVTVAALGEVTKGIAGASLGAGAPVVVGSTNGILIPLLPSGLSTALGSAIGAAGVRWSVGVALKNAAAGDYFPVLINPGQLI